MTIFNFGTVTKLKTCGLLFISLILLNHCAAPIEPHKAYSGDPLGRNQLALLKGSKFARRDWLNQYMDTIRFLKVDGVAIRNSENIEEILITPGEHEVTVYFSWDTGSQRGLAPAMIDYISSKSSLSRTLKLNVSAGQTYHVKGSPVFSDKQAQNITGLDYVDFWVEDDSGFMVVNRSQGRFIPE